MMTRLRVAKPFSRAIRKFPMKGVIHRNGLSTLGASDAHANRGQSAGVGPGSWRCRVSREALCRRQGWRPELTLPETIAQRGVGCQRKPPPDRWPDSTAVKAVVVQRPARALRRVSARYSRYARQPSANAPVYRRQERGKRMSLS